MTIYLGSRLRETSSELPVSQLAPRILLLHQRGFTALRCHQRRKDVAERCFALASRDVYLILLFTFYLRIAPQISIVSVALSLGLVPSRLQADKNRVFPGRR